MRTCEPGFLRDLNPPFLGLRTRASWLRCSLSICRMGCCKGRTGQGVVLTQVFMGLWFVSLEAFLSSPQCVGLHVGWLSQWRPPGSCVTQPRESAMGASVTGSDEQITELRRRLQTAGRLIGLLKASGQKASSISGTSSPILFLRGLDQRRFFRSSP